MGRCAASRRCISVERIPRENIMAGATWLADFMAALQAAAHYGARSVLYDGIAWRKYAPFYFVLFAQHAAFLGVSPAGRSR